MAEGVVGKRNKGREAERAGCQADLSALTGSTIMFTQVGKRIVWRSVPSANGLN